MAKRATSKQQFPDMIYAVVSPRSVGGTSLFDIGQSVDSKASLLEALGTQNIANFFSEERVIYQAINALQTAGFEVLQANELTINIAGPRALFEKTFNSKLIHEERPVLKSIYEEASAGFIECQIGRASCRERV